jgi:hypothetical protein
MPPLTKAPHNTKTHLDERTDGLMLWVLVYKSFVVQRSLNPLGILPDRKNL